MTGAGLRLCEALLSSGKQVRNEVASIFRASSGSVATG